MDEQPDRASGGVPHAFRQALSWRWAKEMPTSLRRGGFLTLLYALSALSDTTGAVRFNRDRKPISIGVIAHAAGCDQKDARRYLRAAEHAGVLQAEAKPGCPTLYTLIVAGAPDWTLASAWLTTTRRVRKDHPAPPWKEANPGGPTPEVTPGDLPPTPSGDLPPGWGGGTYPRGGSGDLPPTTPGDRPPDNPGSTQVLPQDVAGLGGQPQESPASREQQDDHQHDEQPGLRPLPTPVGRRARKDAGIQPPLLAVVPTEVAELRAAAAEDPGLVRTAVLELGSGEATRIYGVRLVNQHARDLIQPDAGTAGA